MVLAAYVYEEAGVTLLCAVTVLFLTFLLIGLLTGHLLKFGSILIVTDKPAELTGHYALDDIVLVHPVKTTEYLRQESLNLLLVDLYTLQVINHLIELFLAYLGAGRHLALYELLAYGLLYETYLAFLAQVHDRYRCTCLAGTTGTAAAMGVVLYVIGQAEVDHMREVIHVKSAGCHIGSHQQLELMFAELVHGQVTLCLRQVAVKGIGVIAVLHEFVRYLLSLQAGTAEYDGVYGGIIVHDTLECQVLVLGMHHIVDVVHVLGALVTGSDHDLTCVVQIFL